MKTYKDKQNEHDLINKFFLRALKKELNPFMDRGSVKYKLNNNTYRFKIKDKVIRKEKQITLPGTIYSKPCKTWMRIKSYSYIKVLKKAKDLKEEVNNV